MNKDFQAKLFEGSVPLRTLALMMVATWGLGSSFMQAQGAQPSATDRAASAVQRDFRIFDYYRETQRPKALLHGSIAYYLQHPIPIKGMTLTTYEATGETNLHAVAESCWIDRTNRVATSPDPVAFQFSGGRFQVQGVGFQWQQTGSILTVSNEVKSVLRQDLFEPRSAPGKSASASASASRNFSPLVSPPHGPFFQNVDLVPESPTPMNSPFTPRSSGFASMLHRPMTSLLLTPWLVTAGVAASPGGSGFSGLLNKPADPKTNAVPAAAPDKKTSSTPTALTAALDASAGSKAETTNNPSKKDSRIQPRGNVAIKAQSVEYQGDSKKVTYWNKVRVDDPEDKPITTIECEWLSTVIPESRESLGEIIGLTNVVITFRGEKPEELTTARGQKVVYNATNDTLVLTGVPATVDYASGLSLSTEGPIIYERKTNKFRATGETKTIVRRALAVPGGKPEKETAPAAPPGPK